MFEATTLDLKDLARFSGDPAITVYLPTDLTGIQTKKSSIRLKNLLSDAAGDLQERGMRAPDVDSILEPAGALIDQVSFWRKRKAGLALFLADGFFEIADLDRRVEPFYRIGTRFHLAPLLGSLWNRLSYLLLALSQKQIRLFEGDSSSLQAIDLEDIPVSYEEYAAVVVPGKQMQHHTITDVGAGRAVYHGSGPDSLDDKEEILRYFNRVDAGLADILEGDSRPLILAGVDYIRALYAQANQYPHLIEAGVSGSPAGVGVKHLHEQAMSVVEEVNQHRKARTIENYRSHAHGGRVSTRIDKILPLAMAGKVETLFVRSGAVVWGRYDSETAGVRLDLPRRASDDLLDLAAVQTFLAGGEVLVLPQEEMPVEAEITALFRYPQEDV